jgi:putative transposase
MERRQTLKYALRPNAEQQRDLCRFAGCCRFVFNQARALQKAHYEAGREYIGYVAMAKLLTQWRRGTETPWLKQAPVHPLQHALKDLERSYQNIFAGRAGFPRFKRKGHRQSFRYPDAQQFEIDESHSRIFLPKLGWIRYRNSRDILGKARNITVGCSAGRWYASIQTERQVEPALPRATTAIGIDLGVARFATLSDGTHIAPLNSFRKHEIRLRRYQRSISRKVKFSKKWRKARRRVQTLHARIANARRDLLHKATTTISKNHAMVCIEDLQVRRLSKSDRGNIQAPGQFVRAKSGMNKSILDQGWFESRRQLAYKLGWNGAMLIAVPPHNTSRTCPVCGHVAAENRRSQARFECVHCGYVQNADVLGAMNVLARGHRVAACGEAGSGPARKSRTKSSLCEAGTHRGDYV